MNNVFKGALAASAAGALLLGGAGTLAFWSDTQNVGTANIDSGKLTLGAPDCLLGVGAHGWQLDGGTPFVPGVTKVVPGDTVSKVCDMVLTLDGAHIGAELGIDTPTFTDTGNLTTLDDELQASATFTVGGIATTTVSTPGVHAVRATVTVTFPNTVTSKTGQASDVDLNAINVLATQTHH